MNLKWVKFDLRAIIESSRGNGFTPGSQFKGSLTIYLPLQIDDIDGVDGSWTGIEFQLFNGECSSKMGVGDGGNRLRMML